MTDVTTREQLRRLRAATDLPLMKLKRMLEQIECSQREQWLAEIESSGRIPELSSPDDFLTTFRQLLYTEHNPQLKQTSEVVPQEPCRIFADCAVKFVLTDGEFFAIRPDYFLNFDRDNSHPANLIAATFELKTTHHHLVFSDHIILGPFVDLSKYFKGIRKMETGAVAHFSTEEDAISITCAKQAKDVLVSGKIPAGFSHELTHSTLYPISKTHFGVQVVFHGRFSFKKISRIAQEMDHVLQLIKSSGLTN